MKKKFINRSGLYVVLTCLILSNCSSSSTPLPDGANARIVKVVDGDTVDVSMDGRTERIRLIGVDTPETKSQIRPFNVSAPKLPNTSKAFFPLAPQYWFNVISRHAIHSVDFLVTSIAHQTISSLIKTSSSMDLPDHFRSPPTPLSPASLPDSPKPPGPQKLVSGASAHQSPNVCR